MARVPGANGSHQVDPHAADPEVVDAHHIDAHHIDAHHIDAHQVEVRRSTRRRRTVSAYRSGDRVVVLLPARLGAAEEQRWVDTMVSRLVRREARVRPGDTALELRALDLSRRYLDGAATPASVRWTDRQNSRWGSCTPADRTIRISSRLRGVPAWVLDYVLVHELAHLLEASHDRQFWALVDRYPRAERAQGFLGGMAHLLDAGVTGGSELAGDDVLPAPVAGLSDPDVLDGSELLGNRDLRSVDELRELPVA